MLANRFFFFSEKTKFSAADPAKKTESSIFKPQYHKEITNKAFALRLDYKKTREVLLNLT